MWSGNSGAGRLKHGCGQDSRPTISAASGIAKVSDLGEDARPSIRGSDLFTPAKQLFSAPPQPVLNDARL